MIRILFQGDSITDGNRYKLVEQRWDKNHQIGHGYVFSIVSTLGQKYPAKYEFINRGVSSEGITRITARWQTDTLDEHPDILSILMGINECGDRQGRLPEGKEAHDKLFDIGYRALLDRALEQNPNLKLIIMEPFLFPAGEAKEYYDKKMPHLIRKQKMIRKIAEDYNAIFIPLQKPIENLIAETSDTIKSNGWELDPAEYWLWDGIHPTEPLHGFIANLWLDAAKDIL